jgi:hypothetical protein
MKEECILITIDEQGRITADAKGFQGEACVKDIELLLQDIAAVQTIDKKDEYYQKQKQKVVPSKQVRIG